jgi:predicted nucleic acid-binding protein
MPFVIDASVTASRLLPDEADTRAEQAYTLLDTESAVVPGLWWFELRNIFVVNERRGRIDEATTQRALKLLASLPIRLDHAAEETALLPSLGDIASRSTMPPISSWRSAKACLSRRWIMSWREQRRPKRWF